MKTINELGSAEVRPLARTLARELNADEVSLVSGAKTGVDPNDDASGEPGYPHYPSDAEMK